ncbi:MAG: METTL5 family protein [Candidatus Nanoarchaeia archaeon]|nr:METTL5 family protein [Candidatus Haiyanarchaeum thermophilum]MCW1302958.1 METTL5 family protein [Candidatus Haiyanarchaeum thermophilum]MCW1303636.1 METTL5 family protein [Candidatus Haiyanarchaeum thermophilum]MCW1306317.1 METTL5 family protein [Candidatus Haiyanarchaeum thermophilum]MCW1307173.1 METTL5 family protein [Candidatus Haiyanarchaeum thermophilum]
MKSKKELEIILSRLKDLEKRYVRWEQYTTPSEVAGQLLWIAYQRGDLKGKLVADLGCGNGILAIGSALLGARKVVAIEIDPRAIEVAKSNYEELKSRYEMSRIDFLCMNIEDFSQKVDVVIMNPPFGIKRKHYDRIFLRKAFEIANKVYSIHKITSIKFYEKFAKEFGFSSHLLHRFEFRLKHCIWYHRKKFHKFDAGIWYFEKIYKN